MACVPTGPVKLDEISVKSETYFLGVLNSEIRPVSCEGGLINSRVCAFKTKNVNKACTCAEGTDIQLEGLLSFSSFVLLIYITNLCIYSTFD